MILPSLEASGVDFKSGTRILEAFTLMKPPKRHHYVPQMLLKRFADAEGRIAFYDKSRPKAGVQMTTPKNLLVQQHLYSKRNRDGSIDGSLEAYYSTLESEAHVLFDKIIVAVLERSIPIISAVEKNIWDRFLYEQWRRVPDLHDEIMPLSNFAEQIREGFEEFEAEFNRPVTAEERELFGGTAALKTFRNNVRVTALNQRSSIVTEAIANKALFFGRTAPQRSFIIGSSPVMKLVPSNTTNNLDNPAVEIWLPIHPNVMVVSAGLKGAGTGHLAALHMDRIRGFNESVAKKSTIFAGRSRELIASLAQKSALAAGRTA